MARITGIALLALGTCAVAMAQQPSPEIDPASGISALAALAGALIILHGRRRRQ
ncbi:MAG TPA: VPEID-CTERM sorting domain-containing protein [Bryobacteraceae bacterium]|nr:VPEID-CTERM sorting domain-containing protein [Bryobacteraceae bacterium]